MVKIAVCGCGFLGSSIAGCLIFFGHDVIIYDINRSALDRFPEELRKKKEELLERELILDRIFSGTYRLEAELEAAVKDVDFIIEAIQENVAAKKAFFQRVSNVCQPSTVLLTSSINFRLEDIFALTANKERTMGLRFLYPVYFVRDVEVQYHEKTSDEAKEKVRRLIVDKLGKTIFLRISGQDPLVLPQEDIIAMEEARRIKLARIRREMPSSTLSSSLQGERGSFATLGSNGHSEDLTDNVFGQENTRQAFHCHGASSRPAFRGTPNCPVFHGASSGQTFQQTACNNVSIPLSLRSLDTETCLGCHLRPTMCVLSPCLHHMCKECAKSLMNRKKGCPVQGCSRDVNSYQTFGT